MKRSIGIILAGIAILALSLSSVAFAQTASPFIGCTNLLTFHDKTCAWHAPDTGGGVYMDDVLFVNWYYWHPKTGDHVTEETYIKGTAPGFTSTEGHRKISFSDTYVITDMAWLNNFPNNTAPPTSCADPAEPTIEPCPAVDQQSAMDFQFAMVADDVDYPF